MNTIQYERLNQDAKDYLKTVKQLGGRGAPGVYFKVDYNRPTWGLILGIFLGIFTLIFAFGFKPGRAPWGVAMGSTAGFLMSGWLILYAFRRWAASPNKFCGKFLYFDPEHVYVGQGEEIGIEYLGNDPEVEPHGQNMIRFTTEESHFYVTVQSRFAAQYVADYYSALSWVRRQREGKWSDLTPPEAGAVARYLAELDEEPGNISDTDLTIEDMPEEVFAERKGSSGILMLLAIPVVGFVMFMVLWSMFTFTHDDEAFDRAKDPQEGGVGIMREYLSNERNTRHRAEAEQYIKDEYAKVMNTVKASGTDPELKNGIIMLLESVSAPDIRIPAVSIRVRRLPFSTDYENEEKNFRTRFADGLGDGLGGPKKDILVCVEAPKDDSKKPHIDIEYSTSGNVINWTVRLRKTPETTERDKGDYFEKTGSTTSSGGGFPGMIAMPGTTTTGQVSTNPTTEAVYTDIMMRMIGKSPALPMALPPPDDE